MSKPGETFAATVTKCLPDGRYDVTLSNGLPLVAFLAPGCEGLRLEPGQSVEVELSPFDPSKCRIVRDDGVTVEVVAAPLQCPDPLRQALSGLLAWTLVTIRNNAADSALCFAHADHMHNVPDLLASFLPGRLAYYWEAERPGFVRQMKAMGKSPPAAFEEFWEVVEREYRRLCKPSNSE